MELGEDKLCARQVSRYLSAVAKLLSMLLLPSSEVVQCKNTIIIEHC